ncbi:MAG TPA: Uma2 family endonuclease [Micromonosporaceae bacterium]|nr:Uma2 family endonuclease [Micromonosporaceae bacterium]
MAAAGTVVWRGDGIYVRPGRWTAQRAVAELPVTTGMTIEVLDGSLVVSPCPSTRHQAALRELAHPLRQAARCAGLAAYPQVDLVCGEDLTCPDIVVVRPLGEERDWVPAADTVLVVEIMSAGSRRKDRFEHPQVYAREKIPHFLRVELRGEDPVFFLHELVGGEYRPVVVAPAGTRFVMREPFDFTIDPAQLVE